MKVIKNVFKAIGHCVWDFLKFFLFITVCCAAILFAFFLITCAIGWVVSFIPEGIVIAVGNAVPYVLGAMLVGSMAIAIGMIIKDEYDRIVAAESAVIPADGQPVISDGKEGEEDDRDVIED